MSNLVDVPSRAREPQRRQHNQPRPAGRGATLTPPARRGGTVAPPPGRPSGTLAPPPAREREGARRPAPPSPAPRPQRSPAPSPAAAWLRSHAPGLVIVAGLLVLAGVLIGTGITRYPAFADDEGTYVAEAWAVITHGQLSHYTYWYDHPPLGWIQLGVLTWLLGGLVKGATAVATARTLMLIPALINTALLYVLGRRLGLRRAFAAIAVLLMIASPLGIAGLRQVYLENFALPWVLGAFILASTPTRRLWAFAAAGACFAIAVLSKETMLLFLPGLALAVFQNADRRTRAFCLTAFISAFVLIGIGYPLYALLKGELLPGRGHVSLEQAVVWQLSGRQGSGSIFNPHSQARQLIAGWLAVDPWLLGLGIGSIPIALFVRRLAPIALALAVAVLVAIHGGYLPEPFDIGLLPFCGLLPAGLLDSLWGHRLLPARGRRLWRPALTLAVLAALALAIVPAWRRGDHYALSSDQTGAVAAAEHWIERHVNHRARVLIDDTMYVDLVRAGFEPRYGVVWFYKLGFANNLDPAIVRHLPHGWREFDYVVSTPVIRSALAHDPHAYRQVREALAHSRTVASFGSGGLQIQVRRLFGAGVGSGRIPEAGRS
jgi:hypothetical protein